MDDTNTTDPIVDLDGGDSTDTTESGNVYMPVYNAAYKPPIINVVPTEIPIAAKDQPVKNHAEI